MESSKLTRWAGPAPAWAAAFIVCVAADVLLGRWVLLPVFVVGFYGGMLIMASLIYPPLERWRLWLRPRGVRAWFLVEVVLWVGIAGGLVLAAPQWLEWSWGGWLPLQASGALLLILSIGASAWALRTMGWSRLLLAAAMFPSGAGAEENHVPQLLVIKGPYRYVRNPIYVLDVGVLFGTALLTGRYDRKLWIEISKGTRCTFPTRQSKEPTLVASVGRRHRYVHTTSGRAPSRTKPPARPRRDRPSGSEEDARPGTGGGGRRLSPSS
ncbi:MAG: hypothetical protein H0T55_02420 [Rubrobacteraceae bacterium]|nr:hypothetical protein [Rubrobacteraceae bacterium]